MLIPLILHIPSVHDVGYLVRCRLPHCHSYGVITDMQYGICLRCQAMSMARYDEDGMPLCSDCGKWAYQFEARDTAGDIDILCPECKIPELSVGRGMMIIVIPTERHLVKHMEFPPDVSEDERAAQRRAIAGMLKRG